MRKNTLPQRHPLRYDILLAC